MISRSLSFPNREGASLSARLDLPVDGQPVACALFAHCFTCSKDLAAVGHIARALTQEGIGVLRFDFTGLGRSEGDFAATHFASNIDDLIAAAAFIGERYEPPALLIGHSLGGPAVLHAAHRLPSVQAVATIGAPCDPAHVRHLLADSIDEIRRRGEADVVLAGRRFTIRNTFLDKLEAAPMHEAIRTLGRALLILHAPLDETVGVDHAAEIFHLARHPKSFVSLDDADHLLTSPPHAAYAGRVIAAWASRYLGAPQRERKQPLADEENRVVVRTEDDGFITEIIANGHALLADEPVAVGGTNLGPTPYDLIVSGLGACTSMTLRLYADRKGWPLEAVSVRLRHQKRHADDCSTCESPSAKIDHITREIELVGPLDEAQRARLLEIADRCPVHRTLEGEIVIETLAAEPTPAKPAGEAGV